MPPKWVIYDHRLNMTLFKWRLTGSEKYLFKQLRLNIRKMGILAANAWHLAQRLKIKQIEDIGATISVIVAFHLQIRDGASREPLSTGVSPPPVVHVALILDFISSLARQ